MSAPMPGYIAYLLRLWPAHDAQGMCWRASVQDVRTGQRQGFANLEALFEFLLDRTEAVSDLTAEEKG